ncbi:EF-hand domain-containing protein [Thalassotalea sp. M1531]|uniref:EF-hand domain-containing protein n=1 Tax=Thalassotalea algicola TaxID=2716224 RepID=A0A7Y0Q6M6_9GAMM|nr:EF-hand domain-containing protein [Thalassotalea algicola]NMP30125.1 EF-hand domain-containing protein [Thalassotalea algicola]
MNVSGNMPMRPPMMSPEKAQERFEQADSDESGGLTIEEMAASAPEGADLSKLEERFSQMDVDGDGEVTTAEHQQAMEARMEKMQERQQNAGYGQPSESGNMLTTLLESLSENDSLNDDQQSKLQQALEQLASGKSKDSVSNAFSLIEEIIPTVDLTA